MRLQVADVSQLLPESRSSLLHLLNVAPGYLQQSIQVLWDSVFSRLLLRDGFLVVRNAKVEGGVY